MCSNGTPGLGCSNTSVKYAAAIEVRSAEDTNRILRDAGRIILYHQLVQLLLSSHILGGIYIDIYQAQCNTHLHHVFPIFFLFLDFH